MSAAFLHQRRLLSRLITRLVLTALVLGSLAPGMSRALAFARGEVTPWAQICTALAGPRQDGQPGNSGEHLLEHCPFCALHSDTLAPPPASTAGLQAPLAGHAVPRLFLQAGCTLPVWAPAQARAPPLRA